MQIRHDISAVPGTFFTRALEVVAVGARNGRAYAEDMPYSSHPSHLQLVTRAVSLIDHHIGEPVTISDLCREAGVSERTLRNAFHDVYGVSPKQFLIRHGLEQVHRALLLARRVRGSVTRAATEYGFFELGRFAGAYRHLFGECPSRTVRRAIAHVHA